ncbi:MAG: hypothetical protein KKG50_06340 [Candidatus Omnitrophica bacterium]|nr:hypothetical protein [Candidatus Omnitrophota bacterium]
MESREREREREREEKEKLQSRDRACPVLKIQKQEIDSQLKVFFKELREIKAVIRDTRSSMLDTRKKKKNAKRTLNSDKRVLSIEKRSLKKGRKLKFRPEITRVKLNPEQAVLTCDCFSLYGGTFGFKSVLRGAGFHSESAVITNQWICQAREYVEQTGWRYGDCLSNDTRLAIS